MPRRPNSGELESRCRCAGVTDGASGAACVMELARVFSQYDFDKKRWCRGFRVKKRAAGEQPLRVGSEQDGLRSTVLTRHHRQRGGQRRIANDGAYSATIRDSPAANSGSLYSRGRQPYVRSCSRAHFPSGRVGRGGDHTPFRWKVSGVRISSPEEDTPHQHPATVLRIHFWPVYRTLTRLNVRRRLAGLPPYAPQGLTLTRARTLRRPASWKEDKESSTWRVCGGDTSDNVALLEHGRCGAGDRVHTPDVSMRHSFPESKQWIRTEMRVVTPYVRRRGQSVLWSSP